MSIFVLFIFTFIIIVKHLFLFTESILNAPQGSSGWPQITMFATLFTMYIYSLYIEQSNSNRAISYFLLLSRSLWLLFASHFDNQIKLKLRRCASALLCFAFFMLEQIFCSCFKFPYSLQLFSNECRMLLSYRSPSPLPPSLHPFHIRRHFLRSFSCPVRMCCLHTVTNSPIQPHTHTHSRTHTHIHADRVCLGMYTMRDSVVKDERRARLA